MKILGHIPEMDSAQLQALLDNARRLSGCDLRAPVVIEACEQELEKRSGFPDARGRAEALMNDIARKQGWLRFRDNQVGDGVKLGDAMLTGPVFASFSVACKPPGEKHAASFEVVLWEPDAEPEFWVRGYLRDDPRDLCGQPLVQTSVLEKAVAVFEYLVNPHKYT